MKTLSLLFAGAALLTACSADPSGASANDGAAAQPVGSVGGVAPTPVASMRGVPEIVPPHEAPALEPIDAVEMKNRNLAGAGCRFRGKAGEPVLLFVTDQGDGLVKYDKRPHRVTAATPDREAIVAGGILAGNNVSFTVTPRQGDARAMAGEWPAMLEMRTADGGERAYRDGQWSCGA
jgi:hypothetical protein